MQSCLPTGGELKNYFTFFERIYLHSCLPTWAQQISSVGVFTVMLTAAWSWRENVLHECKVTEKIWEKKEWIRVSSECWINWEFMWIYVTRSYCTVKNLIWLFGANKHWINKPSWIKKKTIFKSRVDISLHSPALQRLFQPSDCDSFCFLNLKP